MCHVALLKPKPNVSNYCLFITESVIYTYSYRNFAFPCSLHYIYNVRNTDKKPPNAHEIYAIIHHTSQLTRISYTRFGCVRPKNHCFWVGFCIISRSIIHSGQLNLVLRGSANLHLRTFCVFANVKANC